MVGNLALIAGVLAATMAIDSLATDPVITFQKVGGGAQTRFAPGDKVEVFAKFDASPERLNLKIGEAAAIQNVKWGTGGSVSFPRSKPKSDDDTVKIVFTVPSWSTRIPPKIELVESAPDGSPLRRFDLSKLAPTLKLEGLKIDKDKPLVSTPQLTELIRSDGQRYLKIKWKATDNQSGVDRTTLFVMGEKGSAKKGSTIHLSFSQCDANGDCEQNISLDNNEYKRYLDYDAVKVSLATIDFAGNSTNTYGTFKPGKNGDPSRSALRNHASGVQGSGTEQSTHSGSANPD